MFYPPLYFIAVPLMVLALALPLSVLLGAFMYRLARLKMASNRPLMEEYRLKVEANRRRSTLSMIFSVWTKAYGVSILVVVGIFLLYALLAIWSSTIVET